LHIFCCLLFDLMYLNNTITDSFLRDAYSFRLENKGSAVVIGNALTWRLFFNFLRGFPLALNFNKLCVLTFGHPGLQQSFAFLDLFESLMIRDACDSYRIEVPVRV